MQTTLKHSCTCTCIVTCTHSTTDQPTLYSQPAFQHAKVGLRRSTQQAQREPVRRCIPHGTSAACMQQVQQGCSP